MIVLGLLLLVIGVALILAGVFSAETESLTSGGKTDVHTTFLGIDMSASTLFIVALVAATAVFLGLWLMKAGARQGWRRRKDQKRINELERAEAERNGGNRRLTDPGDGFREPGRG